MQNFLQLLINLLPDNSIQMEELNKCLMQANITNMATVMHPLQSKSWRSQNLNLVRCWKCLALYAFFASYILIFVFIWAHFWCILYGLEGTKYPFIKQASDMLGGFPAPPAFTSEFPSKDAALKLNSVAHASSSVHVMAGVIRITNTTSSGNGLDWSYSKNGNVNIVLSFCLPRGDINSSSFLPMGSLLSAKTGSFMARGWFLMLFWVLIISVSLKFGTCIYTR